MTLGVRFIDNIHDVALLSLSQETTSLLDSKEQLPALLGNGVGEVLDGVRATSHVDEFVEMGLLLQQQLLVAGNTLSKLSGLLVRLIERRDDNGIDISKSCRHRLRLGTEQIDIRVEQGLVIL